MKIHRVLSPPRGGRTICSGLHSLDLPLRVFLLSASLRFIPHLQTKTDTTCGADDLFPCLKYIVSRTRFSEHGLFGFIGLSFKVNLIVQYMFISQHIPQMSSNYNNTPVIVCLKFNPYGYDLCLVCFFTLQ